MGNQTSGLIEGRGRSMQTFLRGVALGMVVLALSGIQLPAQETDPLVGAWELNVAKSKFGPGRAPKSETRTYVVSGEDIKATTKGGGQRRKAHRCRIYDQLRRQRPPNDGHSRRRDALPQTCRRVHHGVHAKKSWQGGHDGHTSHLARRQSDDDHDQGHRPNGPNDQRRSGI
jgi:hypothetical protein